MKTNNTSANAGKTSNEKGRSKPVWKTKDPLLKKIITYLCLHYQLKAAYLISKLIHSTEGRYLVSPTKNSRSRQFTYTLFIITDKSPQSVQAPDPGQLMEELFIHTQKQTRVFFIPFTETEVIHHLNTGCNFVSSIIKNAPCIYRRQSEWEKYSALEGVYSPPVYKEISEHWHTRYRRAAYLHNITGIMTTKENPAAHFEVLQKVLQQTCLALIYVFWQFKPGYTEVSYLLHLCSHFAEFPTKIFHTNTYQNHHILHHLCHADALMKFKIQNPLTLKQSNKAWKKCDTFLKEAQTLALQQLQIIEEKCYATTGRK